MQITQVSGKILRSLLVPGVPMCAVPLLAKSESDGPICRPSELPIYVEPPSKSSENKNEPGGSSAASEVLEKGFRTVRLGLSDIFEKFQYQKTLVESKISANKDSIASAITFLREPKNQIHRYGAIGLGGISGYILGLRGGMFRRILLFNIGALGMYSVCYPKESEIHARDALCRAKQAVKIGYNFVNGVKPGDAPLQLPSLPSIPTSLSEITEALAALTDSAKNAISPTKSDNLSEKKDN